jgi:hypothetical protein
LAIAKDVCGLHRSGASTGQANDPVPAMPNGWPGTQDRPNRLLFDWQVGRVAGVLDSSP